MINTLILVLLLSQAWMCRAVVEGQSSEMCTSNSEVSESISNPPRKTFIIEGCVMNVCQCGTEVTIKITGAYSREDGELPLSISSICLSVPMRSCNTTTTKVPTTSNGMETTKPSHTIMQTTDPTTETTQLPGPNSKCPSTAAVPLSLGVLVGILVIVIVPMTIGWTCTCYIMKKRIKEVNTRNGTGIDHVGNPQYGRDDHISLHQNLPPIPTYETIPALPNHQINVNKTELKEPSYDVLHEATPQRIHKSTNEQRRGEKLSLRENNGHTMNSTQTEAKLDGHQAKENATSDGRYGRVDNEMETDFKRGDSEIKPSTLCLQNDKTGDTASEHDYFTLEEDVEVHDNHQLENGDKESEERERDTPKITTAKDYEDFVPSK